MPPFAGSNPPQNQPTTELSREEGSEEDDFREAGEILKDGGRTEAANKELAKPDVQPERREELQAENQRRDENTRRRADGRPDSPAVNLAAVEYFVKAGKPAEGLTYGDRAVVLLESRPDPDPRKLSRALGKRAGAYAQLGDTAKAAEDACRAAELDRRNREAFGLCQMTRGRAAAAPGTRAPADAGLPAVPKPGGKTEDLIAQAESRRKAGDLTGALAVLDSAVKSYPGEPGLHIYKGLAYRDMKDFANAIIEYTRAVNGGLREARLFLLRAQALLESGAFKAALEDARQAAKLDPNDAAAHHAQGRAWLGLGNVREAAASWKQAADRDSAYAPELALLEAKLAASGPAAGQGPAGAARAPSAAAAKPKVPLVVVAGVLGAVGATLLVLGPLLARRKEPVSAAPGRDTPSPSPIEAAPALCSGALIGGHFRLVRELGRGGMGVVWEACDEILKRKVAVKVLRPEMQDHPTERERFLTEARLVAVMDHPNVIKILHILEENRRTCLVMEHVEGHSAHELMRLAPGGRLGLDRIMPLARQICAGLGHAHSKRILHRDIKPSNIMVTSEGIAKLADFGIARQAQESLTRLGITDTVVGTPHYMPAEMEGGIVDREADTYALGATLYHLLTGRVPFGGADWRQRRERCEFTGVAGIVPGLPKALDDFFVKALNPSYEARFRTAEGLRESWEQAASESVSS